MEINWILKIIVFGSELFIYYVIHFEPPRGGLKDDYSIHNHQGVSETQKKYDVIYENSPLPITTQTLHCKLDISPDFGHNIFPIIMFES